LLKSDYLFNYKNNAKVSFANKKLEFFFNGLCMAVSFQDEEISIAGTEDVCS
jgi:hypothetical protein